MALEAVRCTVDTAGGGVIGAAPLQTVLLDTAQPVAIFGEAVANHGSSPHDTATMVGTSAVLRVGGVFVCRQGDAASCGHAATGSGVLRVLA